MEDCPKSLKDKGERVRRVQMLDHEHIMPLTSLVERMRQEQGPRKYIPYFDPLDGGIKAQCLFVLEAPGPKTKESGFVSRNNNDETAKNFFEFNVVAGIPREKTILWNIVPWYVGNSELTKIRNVKKGDIDEGLAYLYQLIELLPQLKGVVLVGKKAQSVSEKLGGKVANISIFPCPHPSPMNVNRDRKIRSEEIIDQLRVVKEKLGL